MLPRIPPILSLLTFGFGLVLFILSTLPNDCQPQNSDDRVVTKDSNHQVKLPLPMGSETRQSAKQDEWEIQWDGTPNTDFYITYGFIIETSGVESEQSASFSGNNLPWNLKFFLDPGITVTATLNLSTTGSVSALLLRNGQPCDSAKQVGQQPSLRVTCFSQ